MAQLRETVEFAQEQLALSDEQLALNALTRYITVAEGEVESSERNLEFTSGYKPTAPGPRPHPEAGGMDHQDWNVARLEYEQYDEDNEIESAEFQVEDATDKLSDLFVLKSEVENGVEDVVSHVAGNERSRLLEVIRRAARAEERKGKEFEGGKELYEALTALQGDTDKLRAASEKTGPHGWQRASYHPTWGHGSVFRVNPGNGPLKSFGSYTQLLEVVTGEDKLTIHYSEMPENGRVTAVNSDWRATIVDYYTLTLDRNGMASEQTHRRGNATQQQYVGSQYSPIFQPVHNYEGVQEFDFGQADIDKFLRIVNKVSSDVEAVQA